MAIKDYIKLVFGAKDELSPETEKMGDSLDDLSAQKRELDQQLKDTTAQEKQITKFRTLEKTLAASEIAFKQASTEVTRLSNEINAAGVPTAAMATDLKKAQEAAKATGKAFTGNTNALAKMAAQTTATVGDISQLDQAEARLKAESKSTAAASSKLGREIRDAGKSAATAATETQGLAKSWGELWAKGTIVIGVLAGVVLGLKSFFTSAGNAEYANQKLADTLRRTTDATNDQITAVKAQAEALQDSTRFSDEEIKAAQAKLATYKLTADQVLKLTPLVLDMAEAKRESGDADADTIGSAEAIADAYRDNITALESFAVHITDATEEQYKNADEAERLAIVIDRLTDSFGGAAVAAGETFHGAIDKTSNAVADTLEIWSSFITQNETVQALLKDVSDLFKDMGTSAKESSQGAASAISTLAGVLGNVFDLLVIAGNLVDTTWQGLRVSVLGVEKAALSAWAAINDALGNDEAARGARELAEVVDQQLAEAFKTIEKNGQDVAASLEKGVNRWNTFGQTVNDVAGELDGATTATNALRNATDQNTKQQSQAAAELKDLYAGLGLSYDKVTQGIDSGTTQTVTNFGKIIKEVAKTTSNTRELADALGPALQATLAKIDTPEGLVALQKEIAKAAASTDGFAGSILGTLTPALAQHEKDLEKNGQYVSKVQERYAAMAKLFGVELVDSLGDATDATNENTESVKEAGDAAEDTADKTIDSADKVVKTVSAKGGGLAAFFNAASQQMYGLSEAAGQAFELNLGRAVTDGVDYYTKKSEESLKSLERSMGRVTVNGMDKWVNGVAIASLQVQADFYAQKASVEGLTQALNDTEHPSEGLIERAARAADNFDLLDDATLSQLTGQIDSARAAIKSLEDTAASTLASIAQRLGNAKGEYSVVVKNQWAQEIAELEGKLTEARAYGNTESVRDLTEALRQARELSLLEITEARARETREQNQDKSTPVQINIAGQTVNADVKESELNKLRTINRWG